MLDLQFLVLCTDTSSKHFGKIGWGAEAIYDEEPLFEATSYEDFLIQVRDIAPHAGARMPRSRA